MNGTHLRGLEGTNPLSFFAALGVQAAFADEDEQPRLWWSDDITPHAVVDEAFNADRIATRAQEAFAQWKNSPAVNPERHDGSSMPRGDELKLIPRDIRAYLSHSIRHGRSGDLASALVAEGSLDNSGVAKPSDFYFTAGQQKFLDTARKILNAVEREDIERGLEGPWSYESEVPSLGWDVTDDRVYALRANNPSPEKKLTNPGPEALALLGLSLHPVYAGRGRTETQGCSGSWKAGWYSWPLWHRPASPRAVKSLLAHAYGHPAASNRDRWYRAWGISTILRSPIRRTDQGGYGTFGPPEVVFFGAAAASEVPGVPPIHPVDRGAAPAAGAGRSDTSAQPSNAPETAVDRWQAMDQGVAGALARFARIVRERFGDSVIDIRLFGSHARSTAHEESDVDVAVVLHEAGWETRRAIIDLAADIGLEHGLTLSPTVFDRETYERWRIQDRPLIRDIEDEGISL